MLIFATAGLLAVSTCNLASTYGPTSSNDRLWEIANEVRPNATVSKQQTMVALLTANPSAFKNRNVNGLRAGYTLRVPRFETIQEIDPWRALRQVQTQNAQWRSPEPDQSVINESTPATTDISELTAAQTDAYDNLMKYFQTQMMAAQIQLKEFIQQSNGRISALEDQNNALREQIAVLNNQVQILARRPLNDSTFIPVSATQSLGVYNLLFIGALVTSLLFLLVLWWSNNRSRLRAIQSDQRHIPTIDSIDEEDTEDEYDYLNSREGIAAKIDLARAYIDMGDQELAKQALADVLKQGDEAQQQTAQELIDRLQGEIA